MKEPILLIGNGFIGDKLAKRLSELGFEVSIATLSTGHDIRNREQMYDLIGNFSGKKVILNAAIADLNVFEADPEQGLDVNVGGLHNVALACLKHKKQLVFVSTCCAYGNTKDLPSTEESRPEPSEIYAACKLAGEWIVKGFHRSYDLDYIILRIATTYGPNMRVALAPAVFINQITKGEPITIHGDGKQTRTLTYIDDEVEGMAQAIAHGKLNETYNISTQEEVSVNYMVDTIRDLMGNPTSPVTHITNRKGQTFVEQIDASKALRDFGWEAKVSFREGIQKTLDWMRENNITIL